MAHVDREQLRIKADIRSILCDLLPGQDWSYQPLCEIITRCFNRVGLPAELGQNWPAHIESFLLAAPSGTGKTQFATTLSPRLNNGQLYFHLIVAVKSTGSIGTRIVREFQTALTTWTDQFAKIRSANPGAQCPIVVVLVDELDQASKPFLQCFHHLLATGALLIPRKSKGGDMETEEIHLPHGWAFIFIFAPNAAADKYLQLMPVDDADHQHRWVAVWDDVMKNTQLSETSLQRRLLPSIHESQCLVLLYKLQGPRLVLRCRRALAVCIEQFRTRQNLTIEIDADAEVKLALWSEQSRPVFDQLRASLMERIASLHNRKVHISILGQGFIGWRSIQDGPIEGLDDNFINALGGGPARPILGLGPEGGGGGGGGIVPFPRAQAAPVAAPPGALFPRHPTHGSIPLDVWLAASQPDANGVSWFPRTQAAVSGLYNAAGIQHPLDFDLHFDRVRKQLSRRVNNVKLETQVRDDGQSHWFRTEDFRKVWESKAAPQRPREVVDLSDDGRGHPALAQHPAGTRRDRLVTPHNNVMAAAAAAGRHAGHPVASLFHSPTLASSMAAAARPLHAADASPWSASVARMLLSGAASYAAPTHRIPPPQGSAGDSLRRPPAPAPVRSFTHTPAAAPSVPHTLVAHSAAAYSGAGLQPYRPQPQRAQALHGQASVTNVRGGGYANVATRRSAFHTHGPSSVPMTLSDSLDEEMLPPLEAASSRVASHAPLSNEAAAVDQWLLAYVRQIPALTGPQSALLKSMVARNPSLHKYQLPPFNSLALLPFAHLPHNPLDGNDDLVRRLCASITLAFKGVEVKMWDYRLLHSDGVLRVSLAVSLDAPDDNMHIGVHFSPMLYCWCALLQTTAPVVRHYIDLLNAVTHGHVNLNRFNARYMVVIDLPVLILLRRSFSSGLDGMPCMTFIQRLIERGVTAAKTSNRLRHDLRVHCFKVVGHRLHGPLGPRVELRFQEFADNRHDAVLHREFPTLTSPNLPLEPWERADPNGHELLGLLHELSTTYLEAYQQSCVKFAARTPYAEHRSISGFTHTIFHREVEDFDRFCVSRAEAEALKRFLRSKDRSVPATVQPSSEEDALFQALLDAEADKAEENDEMYRQHLADERSKSKRPRLEDDAEDDADADAEDEDEDDDDDA